MGAGETGIALLKWIVIFTAICAIMLILRAWSARIQNRKAYIDDWLVVIAFASVVALDGVGIWAIFNGLGKHTTELSAYEIGVQQQLVTAANVCWLVGTIFNKLSVLCLYRRIFKTPTFLRWSTGVIMVTIAFGIAFFVVFLTQCHPVSYLWNPVPGGGCRNLAYQEYASVSANLAIDIAIFILPLPVLWTLQMTTRYKFYVTIMLSFGLITIAVMAWRIQATYQSATNPDFVYTLATVGLISGLELWLGIIVACMPTITPVIKVGVWPVLQRLTSYYDSLRSGSRLKAGSDQHSSSPNDVQLKDYSRHTIGGGPLDEPLSFSAKVSSLGKGQSFGVSRALGRSRRGERDSSLYETIDDEGRVLFTARGGEALVTDTEMRAASTHS